MTEELAQEIATHQAELEKLLSRLPSPDLVTVSDRDGNHLNGNQSGYLQLAIECLNSAQGRSVGLWNRVWLRCDMWTFAGLQVDPAAASWRRSDGSYRSAGCFVAICAVVALLLIGIFTVGHSLYHWAVTPAH